VFTAGASEGGPYTVTATTGGIDGTAEVTIAIKPPVHLKINCGKNDYDVEGWERDDLYIDEGDDWTNSNTVSTDGVANAAPAMVYKSVRHKKPHTYSFGPDIVPDGDYLVRLHLADAYNSDDRNAKYIIEGQEVVNNLNYSTEAGGNNKALVLEYNVSVSDGNGLQILCDADGNDVFEGGIEVIETEEPQPIVEVLNPVGGETFYIGEVLHIRWRTIESEVDDVQIYLLVGGLQEYEILTKSIDVNDPDWSDYAWTIPESLDGDQLDGSVCQIKIIEYSGIPYDKSDPFTIVKNVTSVKENAALNIVKAYPNPVKNIINVSVEGGFVQRLTLINAAGVVVRSVDNSMSLDVRDLPTGVYSFLVRSSGGVTRHTLIKQ
jgi:hypothetical protein